MMERLTTTIGRDKRLESLPFCAKTEDGIEVVSGHHRFRAARAAKMKELFILLDVTGLNRDQIRAKQLAHNAIEGTDDESILRQIYSAIDDAEAKLEAFIDISMEDIEVPSVPIDNVVFDMPLRTVTISFMPTEKERFEEMEQKLIADGEELWLAERKLFEPFIELLKKTGREYDIRSNGTTLDRMARIVLAQLGSEQPSEDEEIIAIRDLLGRAWVRKGAGAEKLKAFVKQLKEDGQI